MAETIERLLADEAATARLGEDIAAALRPGDVVLLSGELGAGKTTLARALIRALAGNPDLDVPSPTYTLVQIYEGRLRAHHFDLYRLSGPDELDELGFDDVGTGIAVVEWPERAAERLADSGVRIRLKDSGTGRMATLSGTATDRLARSLAIRDFLAAAGWEKASRRFLLGDASTRAYETVDLPGRPTRILMNAPQRPDGPPVRDGLPYSRIAHLAESVTPFVAIDAVLRAAGFCAPEVFAADLAQGLLLIEHLGNDTVLSADGAPIRERYLAAAELLAAMHARSWPTRIEEGGGDYHVPAYDDRALAIEAELLLDWYVAYAGGAEPDGGMRERFARVWSALFARLAGAEKSLVLRDYHSPNIIWRGERTGSDRIGLIDFQDAVIGPSAYDVASLAQDARVTIPTDLEAAIVGAYTDARRSSGCFDQAAFEEAYAITAAQRNSKILGIFVRLDRRDGKPHYLKHLPRIRAYLARALAHPALADLKALYADLGVLDGDGA